MKSINFEILNDRWPELKTLGAFAERYAWHDPAGSLVNLSTSAETMAQHKKKFHIFDHWGDFEFFELSLPRVLRIV